MTLLEHEAMLDRALRAYEATRATIGPEDIQGRHGHYEATRALQSWFIDWFDENEAPENQSIDDMDAEYASSEIFAEMWLDAMDARRDIEETEQSLNRASNFI
jgi:hypothetical protein